MRTASLPRLALLLALGPLVTLAPAVAATDDLPADAPQRRISLDFTGVGVRQLLPVFGDFTGLNIIASDSVRGELTLRLKDVPWPQALQVVLDAAGLASRREGNVLWIAPRAEIAEKERQALQDWQRRAALEPVRTEVFRLNYAKAEQVHGMLRGNSRPAARGGALAQLPAAASWPAGRSALAAGTAAGATEAQGQAGDTPEQTPSVLHATGEPGADGASRLLSWRGSVTADSRTNQLIVSDLPERLDAVRALLSTIDIPARQVLIEAKVVEADDTFSRNLGVKLGFASRQGQSAVASRYGSALPRVPAAAAENADAEHALFSMPAGALRGVAPASIAVSLFSRAAGRLLALELSALEADGEGRILSTPRVVTADHARALIEQGTELPYQSASASGATSVQFRKANLRLEVTPMITPEGHVLMDVDISKDSVGIQTTQGFAIDTKHVQTQVLVENGGTVVLGGIYTQTRRTDVTRVPGLGDLPGIGRLFRGQAKVDDRTELLMFLTPSILEP
ncbi:type IV pilus secretin PilQ [Cupriavidus sp. AU9028]|nr:type IV pilus secretin PilQ [Cupriavidus sp. AU9028]